MPLRVTVATTPKRFDRPGRRGRGPTNCASYRRATAPRRPANSNVPPSLPPSRPLSRCPVSRITRDTWDTCLTPNPKRLHPLRLGRYRVNLPLPRESTLALVSAEPHPVTGALGCSRAQAGAARTPPLFRSSTSAMSTGQLQCSAIPPLRPVHCPAVPCPALPGTHGTLASRRSQARGRRRRPQDNREPRARILERA